MLIGIWIWVTDMELDLVFDWLEPKRFVPPASLKETAIIVASAVLLLLLFVSARDPFYFGVIFVLQTGMVLWSTRYFNREFAWALNESRRRLAVDFEVPAFVHRARLYKSGHDILEMYFLRRPHTPRHVVILISGVAGTIVGGVARFRDSATAATAAYIVFIVTIGVSEAVIFGWRGRRDRDLRLIAAELGESEEDTYRDGKDVENA